MRKALIKSIIAILVSLLALLFYYYFNLKQSNIAVKKPKLINYTHIKTIYGPSEKIRFESLQGIGLDNDNNIYVIDPLRIKADIFTENGDFIRSINLKNKGEKQVSKPVDVAVSDNGNLLVTDINNHKVVVYDKNGKFKSQWQVPYPHFIKIKNNEAYLTSNGAIYAYSKKGILLFKWGKKGRNYNQLYGSYGLVPDKDTIFIADTFNNRLIALNKNSGIEWTLGSPSRKMNDLSVKFQVPVGLTEDENGVLYLSDAFDFSIQAISKKGKFIEKFGKNGSRDGEFIYPSDIEYLGERRFVIVDKGNNRVQIVRIPVTKKITIATHGKNKQVPGSAIEKSFIERSLNFFRTLLGQ